MECQYAELGYGGRARARVGNCRGVAQNTPVQDNGHAPRVARRIGCAGRVCARTRLKCACCVVQMGCAYSAPQGRARERERRRVQAQRGVAVARARAFLSVNLALTSRSYLVEFVKALLEMDGRADHGHTGRKKDKLHRDGGVRVER